MHKHCLTSSLIRPFSKFKSSCRLDCTLVTSSYDNTASPSSMAGPRYIHTLKLFINFSTLSFNTCQTVQPSSITILAVPLDSPRVLSEGNPALSSLKEFVCLPPSPLPSASSPPTAPIGSLSQYRPHIGIHPYQVLKRHYRFFSRHVLHCLCQHSHHCLRLLFTETCPGINVSIMFSGHTKIS